MALLKKAKIFLLLAGFLLLGFIIHRIGLEQIGEELGKLGANAVFLLIPYAAVHLLDSLGWRATMGTMAKGVRFWKIFLTRLAGEAINYITPSAYLAGEPVKAYLLKKHRVPMIKGLASVVTAKTMVIVTQVLFVLLGVILLSLRSPDSSKIIYASLLIVGVITLGLGVLIFAQRRGLFTGILRVLEAIKLPAGFLKRREHHLQELDQRIRGFYDEDRVGFLFSLGFFMVGWLVGSLEIYLLISFLDIPVDLSTAISLEALTTVIRAAVFFIPSGVGVLEGGVVFLFDAFGYSPVTAITYAIVRRLREALWIGIGLSYLVKHEVSVVQ